MNIFVLGLLMFPVAHAARTMYTGPTGPAAPSAYAVPLAHAAAIVITSYSCRVALYAEDLPNGSAETTLVRPFTAQGAHGGDPFEFKVGEHTVSVVADSKWRGLLWERAGQMLAHSLTAGTYAITGNQVMILSNPKKPSEVVQLICDPLPGDFPKE